MKREIYFCDGWFTLRKRATKLLSWSEASRLHDKGETYTVLIDSDVKPTVGLNIIKNDYVGVFFFDDQIRDYLWYQFKVSKKYPNKLFLSLRQTREFIGDTFEVKHNQMCYFKENGHVKVEEGIPLNDGSKGFDVTSYETIIDLLDTNYADFPNFGEYDDLIRKR